MMREVLKRRGGGEFLAMKEQGDEWRSQNQAETCFGPLEPNDVLKPVARRAIPHLVMVLDAADETMH